MKLSRVGCLGISLVGVLIVMMIGLIGLTSALSVRTSYYTPEQRQFLSSNEGLRMRQDAPTVNTYGYVGKVDELLDKDQPISAPPLATGARETHVTADLAVRYKERDGATVTAYDLQFVASYLIANPNAQQTILDMVFPFPGNAAVLSAVTFSVDGAEPPGVTYSMQNIHWRAVLEPGQERRIEVSYRAEGVGSFAYGLPSSQRIRDFDLQVTVSGANEINIPESALAPSERQDEAGKTTLAWRYKDVITNRSVQVELPARQSLAFAQRVEKLGDFFVMLALAAPVLTCLFLFCLWAAERLEALKIGLEHNILLGIGFFLFYPLFIFSAGFVDLPLAFALALVVAGALLIGYGVRTLGRQLAVIYLLPLIVVFYGLLSRGLTAQRFLDLGMMLVVSSVLLVALFMWRFSLRRQPITPVAPVQDKAAEAVPIAMAQEAAPQVVKEKSAPKALERFCIHCGQHVDISFKFCPRCGKETQATRKCAGCGLEYIPAEGAPGFCPACGKKLN